MTRPRIEAARLRERLSALARIGADPRGGVSRLALTDADRAGRDLLVRWMRELDLEVRVDDVGNIYGRRPGLDPAAPAVMVGSHIDTVPMGGMFDGALGVVAGLEVVRTLNEEGIRTRCPIEVASFTNEEGSRFEPSMAGSGVIAGVFAREEIASCRARDDGARFEDELRRIGYLGVPEHRPGPLLAYLEFHIEQGPVLEREGLACGVVEGIVGFTWLEVELRGDANHAGTTPMDARRDALVAAARVIRAVRDLMLWLGDGCVSTVGRIRVEPDVINAVPGRAVFSLDLRHRDEDRLAEAVRIARNLVAREAAAEGVEAEVRHIRTTPPVRFAEEVVRALEDALGELGVPYRRMVSGAGHDAQHMARLAPAAMLFVPSRGGKSHCPDEWTDFEHAALGATALLHAVLRLAGAA